MSDLTDVLAVWGITLNERHAEQLLQDMLAAIVKDRKNSEKKKEVTDE